MSRVRPASRHRSREAALQVLYALDLSRPGPPAPEAADAALEDTARHFELPEGARAFAAELVGGVVAHCADLDAVLAKHATHWRLDRMAAVDRNVLRLAAWEIRFGQTPTAAAIDEAVDLARRFGGERSPGFVNGVLDAVARAEAEARE